MKPEDALLHAILEQPEDDVPRLVYADWLEENGDADRAAFIRLQIELAKLPENDRHHRSNPRESELLRKHRATWARGLPPWARKGTFCRGFVEAVSATARQFLKDGARLRRLTPLRVLQIERVNGFLPPVAAAPHLAGLATLVISGDNLDAVEVAQLASSPHLAGLTRLQFTWRCRIAPEASRALADSPHLASLTDLDLLGNRMGPAGARALADSPHLTRLRQLNLQANYISDEGAEALARAPRLVSSLTTLILSWNDIRPAGAGALARCPHLAHLKSLELMANPLGDAGAAALASSPGLAGLTHLGLRECKISDAGARALADSPHLGNLVSLHLYQNKIGDPGARALLDSPHLRGLRELSLSGNRRLGEEVLQAIRQRFGLGGLG
jgi:uncharacterized protein (TIGR02996 family)